MIYLFTATFPFGNAESFLEDEILYLSRKFDEVQIIPLSGGMFKKREVPSNCNVHTPIIKSRLQKLVRGLFHHKTFVTYMKDFFQRRCFCDRVRFREWCASYFNTNCALHDQYIRNLSLSPKDVCYFYWGKGLNPLSLFFSNDAKCVSRFHGEWDLWEETGHGYAPIRSILAKRLNLAVFISEKGESYFHKRYPYCETMVSRLGSRDMGIGTKSTDDHIRIVSCSAVYDLKRVPLIFESICRISNKKVIWTHLGDGPDFESLKEMVKSAPSNISVNLKGWISHEEVLAFYKNNPVDVFINLSTNEGIPVSIMEAISFDIPVVATNVGGTSEIVNDKTGILISANPTTEEASRAIQNVVIGNLNPRGFWDKYYNAEKNYYEFANIISNL